MMVGSQVGVGLTWRTICALFPSLVPVKGGSKNIRMVVSFHRTVQQMGYLLNTKLARRFQGEDNMQLRYYHVRQVEPCHH